MKAIYHYCALTNYGMGNLAYRDGYHEIERDGTLDAEKLRQEVAAAFVPPRKPEQVIFLSLTRLDQ